MGTLDLIQKSWMNFIMLIFFFISNFIAKNFKFHLNSKLEIFFVLITEVILKAGHNSDPNSGNRHLQGYYIEREEITSKLNYLNKIKF